MKLIDEVGGERLLFAWTVAAGLCLLQTTVIATVVGAGGTGHPLAPFIATLVVTLSGMLLARYDTRRAFVGGTPVLAAIVGVSLGYPHQIPELLVTSFAAAVTCVAGVSLGASRLPRWMDGRVADHRVPWWIACAFAALFLVQLTRVGVYIDDPSMKYGAAVPSASAHSCLPAYLHAAELASARVDNLYLAALYENGADTSVAGMGEHMRDPFVYPPTALLAPAIALSAGRSFPELNALWFALQTMAVFAAAVALASRLGPRARVPGVWLALPLVASLPVLTALQYGQAHVVTLCASFAAMLAFRKSWFAVGGALLGLAISIKLFPAVLLVYLASRGRWRAVTSTAVACAMYLTLTWLWFGAAPLLAFAQYQLPRLADGEAFAKFYQQAGIDTVHMGIPGVAISLQQLGLLDLDVSAAKPLGWLYGIGVLAVAWSLGRRRETPLAWLALVCLASTAALYAPAGYTAAGTLWLIAALLATTWDRPPLAWMVVGVATALQLAPFASDLPLLHTIPGIAIAASLACAALGLAVHLVPMLLIPTRVAMKEGVACASSY